MNYLLEDIVNIIDGNCLNIPEIKIKEVSIDSRTISSPAETIFFAIEGERNNGHDFIEGLIKKGTKVFVINKLKKQFESHQDISFIKVNNTLQAFQLFARHHRLHFKYPVIAITGSNGKTIIKEWLYQSLFEDKNIVRSPKSYNSQVGVPLSLLLMSETNELAVFEAGISQPGEMEKLQEMIQPDWGIISNIGEAHQVNFSSIIEKVNEKLKLFKSCKTIFYCNEYEEIEIGLRKLYPEKELICWSRSKKADLEILKINKSNKETTIQANYKNNNCTINIPFTDNASIENAIHIWLILLKIGIDGSTIKKRLKNLQPVAMRLEIKQGINSCTIINDSYNSDLNSVKIAIDFLKQQNQNSQKTVILSDIVQSGNKTALYKSIAEIINNSGIQKFIGIGEELASFSNLYKKGLNYFYKTTDSFLKDLKTDTFLNEAILLKGARQFEFEKISKILEYKIHRTVLEINMNNLIHNYNFFKSKVNPSTKLLIMVKGFSYGSGSYEIASLFQHHGADYLGVAFADEGVELRRNGIFLPVIVLQAEEESYNTMIENKLEPEIFSFESLKKFIEILKKTGEQNYPLHIKVDTRMHRMGFSMKDLDKLITLLKTEKTVFIKSVFSHLAASDEPAHDNFTKTQLQLFNEIKHKFTASFNYKIIFHILNSEGILRFPEGQHDMVRLGIGLYGVSNACPNSLLPISTLKTRIIQIKSVEKGETIGYSRKGIAKEKMTIGIIPIGYADGLDRRFSNGVGKVFINGKYAPITGNICMDVTMIDISKLEANINDEVVIFGKEIPVVEMAEKIHTIPYEILTGISHRVKRIYFKE